jgi:hypothetical protein
VPFGTARAPSPFLALEAASNLHDLVISFNPVRGNGVEAQRAEAPAISEVLRGRDVETAPGQGLADAADVQPEAGACTEKPSTSR